MIEERRTSITQKAKIFIVVFTAATAAFFGAAGYAVYNGVQEREKQEQANQATCDAVNGLRQDFVDVITDQQERGLANVKKLGLDVKQAEKDYADTLAKIGDEECP